MERRSTYEELELRIKELEMKLRDLKEAEKKLRETQNIKQLLKFAPFGVYLIDLSGKIVACNENGAERLGKTIETSIGTVLIIQLMCRGLCEMGGFMPRKAD